MRAINHSLTGALIGLTVDEPVLAAVLAVVSHYVLDFLPHYGDKGNSKHIHSWQFNLLLGFDALLCAALVVSLLIIRPIRWPMAIICAFLAAAPDFLSINEFYCKVIKKASWRPNLYSRIAQRIQWFERPAGIVVEITWFIAAIFCLSVVIRA